MSGRQNFSIIDKYDEDTEENDWLFEKKTTSKSTFYNDDDDNQQDKWFSTWRIIPGFICCIGLLIGCLYLAESFYNSEYSKDPSFNLWCVGNCDDPMLLNTIQTTPSIILMGGGNDVEEAFVNQIKNSNGGDFLVLQVYGSDEYNHYIYNLSTFYNFPLNSVTTILLNTNEASSDQIVLDNINNAAGIFFPDGNSISFYIFSNQSI
jgi:hypothetical protein